MRTISKGSNGLLTRTTALIAVVAISALASYRRSEISAASPQIELLARTVSRSERVVEARFSGPFPWAPLRRPELPKNAEQSAELEAAAGRLLSDGDRTRSHETLRAAGIARVLLGSPEDGVRRLERVCHADPRDAEAWNDLSAARYTLAVDRNDPELLPAALSAADRALRLSPSLTSARFNRALVLTHLGMRNTAMEAWRSARETEPDRRWAAEAGKRLSILRSEGTPPIERNIQDALQAAERGNETLLVALVDAHPQEARTSAETLFLSGWAEAAHKGDSKGAARALKSARHIAGLLERMNGDSLLSDAVRAIDEASPHNRSLLVRAYLAYRNARNHSAADHPNSAAELLAAADTFARAHSPMRHLARYYAATAFRASNRPEECRKELERVLASIDADRYPSVAAGAEKELGLYYGFRGMWTTSLKHVERSEALFSAHGEQVNAAFAEGTMGEAYDRIGDFEHGWYHRVHSLDVLTRSPPDRRSQAVMIGAVHAEIMRANYESALSLLQVAREEAGRVHAPDMTAETLLREAQVLFITGKEKEASRSLAVAKEASASIEDDGKRGRVAAEIDVVDAAIKRRSDPTSAIESATAAVKYFEAHELFILLPDAYLERGRAHLARGEAREAKNDFECGLQSIERQRTNLALDTRPTVFDTVPELTGELARLLLANGDEEGAYTVVERARARTLIESLGVATDPGSASLSATMRALPPDGVIIEYALLPDAVVAFCVTPKVLTVYRLEARPAEIRHSIAELRAAIERRSEIADMLRVSQKLYDDLLRPLEPSTAGAEVLYIAPDRFLNATPFAALYDSHARKYLIEEHPLVLTPSGTFVLRRTRLRRRTRPALIIADPTNAAGGRRLYVSRREAIELASFYDATPLVGPDATIDRFLKESPKSALIQYVGHAHSDDATGGFLPLAPVHGNDGRLDAGVISRLPLRRTDLVVLSACATMRGDVSRIEGMPSLSRAFLTAGAPAVIGTLWEVDERPTAELLHRLHQHLHDNMPASRALRETQLEMLNDGNRELQHPAAWAAAEFLGTD